MVNTNITYETGTDEPLHPDFTVAARLIEVAISDCEYGCKIYADPRSNVTVLGHNRLYGCRVTKSEIDAENQQYEALARDCESVEV